ncbi:MAG: DNA-directed RNA polymerase subunit H [Candidatus Diapherotrites archaeon]
MGLEKSGLEKVGNHFLVPKHEIVPEEKVEEILKKFGSTADQFPQLLKDDPAVEEIGGKKGDFIKITRSSQTAGISVYYRVVV